MAFTTPRTWVDGTVPTATDLNTEIRDNMVALRYPLVSSTFSTTASKTFDLVFTSDYSAYELCYTPFDAITSTATWTFQFRDGTPAGLSSGYVYTQTYMPYTTSTAVTLASLGSNSVEGSVASNFALQGAGRVLIQNPFLATSITTVVGDLMIRGATYVSGNTVKYAGYHNVQTSVRGITVTPGGGAGIITLAGLA